MRTADLFAFARRTPSGGYEVLHLGPSAAINREADPGHPRWGWAMGAGMDSLLVHLFGKPAEVPADATADLETVTWHPGRKSPSLKTTAATSASLRRCLVRT